MTTEKSIEMIDEYLLEPNNINKEWVECLQLCKQALAENEQLKAEIETLKTNNHSLCLTLQNRARVERAEAIKEFWEKLKTEARLRNHTNYGKNELATVHNEGVIITRKHTLVCGDNLVKEMVGDKE